MFAQRHFTGVVVLLVIVLSLYSSAIQTHAQEPDALSLGPGDFPGDAKTLSSGYVETGKIMHPFHLADFPESPGSERENQNPALYAYTQVHMFSTVVPGDHIVAMGNWIYAYPSIEYESTAQNSPGP